MTGIMMTMADVSGIISISPDSATDSVTDLDIYPARYALYGCVTYRPPDKRAYIKISFLISQPKLMLWVLKRTV